MVESLMLHPAILAARGFESLSTADMRFLHAYRRHFDEAKDLIKTHVFRIEDFNLGGILNPRSKYLHPEHAFHEAKRRIDSFPYLTLVEVRMHFYYGDIMRIFEQLMMELYRDLDAFAKVNRLSESFFVAEHATILQLESSPAYLKISGLHRCGMGDKLSHAFAYVFDRYRMLVTD